jgi:hypothetical protein
MIAGLYPYCRNGVVSRPVIALEEIPKSLAVVQAQDGRSTHIDPGGRRVHGQWFLDLDGFHKGFARARDDAGWMHIDARGAPVYARRFAAVEPFYNVRPGSNASTADSR